MIGLLMARQNKYPESLAHGWDATNKVIFVSEECHYSMVMSANVIGIG